MASTSSEGEPKPERGRTLGLLEKIFAATTALLTLVSVALGIAFKQSSDARQDLNGALSSAQTSSDSLIHQNNDLKAQVAALTNEVASLKGASPSPSTPPATGSGTVVKQGRMVLDGGDWGQLDTGVTGTGSNEDNNSLYIPDTADQSVSLDIEYGQSWWTRVTGDQTFDSCSAALAAHMDSNYVIANNPTGTEIGPSAQLCAHLKTGFVATVHVDDLTSIPNQPPKLTLTYTLWHS